MGVCWLGRVLVRVRVRALRDAWCVRARARGWLERARAARLSAVMWLWQDEEAWTAGTAAASAGATKSSEGLTQTAGDGTKTNNKGLTQIARKGHDAPEFKFRVYQRLKEAKESTTVPDEASELTCFMEHYKNCTTLGGQCVQCIVAINWVRMKERTPMTQGMPLLDLGGGFSMIPRSWLSFRCMGGAVKRGCVVCAEALVAGKK